MRQTHLIHGDKKLASEAVHLLEVLVSNEIDADVLGYFLPGLLSGLVRLLSRKGSMERCFWGGKEVQSLRMVICLLSDPWLDLLASMFAKQDCSTIPHGV